MSGGAVAKPAAGLQWFPFLAVLICTMGALALLLVAAARQANVKASRSVAVEPEDVKSVQEELEWRNAQLAESRAKTQNELTQARVQLSHIEDHLRRLREQLERLSTAARALQAADAEKTDANAQAQLAALKRQIAAAHEKLAEAECVVRERPNSYCIVPYEGPNETRRRPIYIECRADAVVLQPEGIVLTPTDFAGPLGAGNPLAASLRAQREYLSGHVAAGEKQQEPYPLLLVRPDGVVAYYAARAALASWGTEFGYELIGEDWQLQLPEPDPELARVTKDVLADARQRQHQLMLAAPGRYGRPQVTYRASPGGGGFVAERKPHSRGRGGFAPPAGGGFAGDSLDSGKPHRPQPGPQGTAASGSEAPQPSDASKPSEASVAAGGSPHKPASLAQSRGRDWGLPDAGPGSVAVARPVFVECRADRLVILPEDGSGGGKEVALGATTQDSMDEFVASVWQHMKTWGIAGKGLYWRPTLLVTVTPGAANRYAELKTLLTDSGLEVRERQSQGSAAALPSGAIRRK